MSEDEEKAKKYGLNSHVWDKIRHIAGKALYESDDIKLEKMPNTEEARRFVETAMILAADDAHSGLYITHPVEYMRKQKEKAISR